MALVPTLRLTVNPAVRRGVDGTSDAIVMVIPDKFSQPYERTSGPQRRAGLMERLRTSGWRAGTDIGDENPNSHNWSATWDTNQLLQLTHLSTTAPFISAVIANQDRDHTEHWWRTARSSGWITALFITEASLQDEEAVMQAVAEGKFLCIAMPLSRA